ncbi:MAG TPA: hypothetical protein VHH32_11340 [Gemmatimonadales bacterium]|nr:hypothetical protein [Gemmatimonadales bacterium]
MITVLTTFAAAPLAAQSQPEPVRNPTFRFTREAGTELRGLWQASVEAREERVACLASTIRNDTVLVTRVAAVAPHEADSMGISAAASVEQCGPPAWSGTVHTHIVLYTEDLPSKRFSAQDRIAMRLWYDRWRTDGVFCVVYSPEDAHCEADGVVGGLRSRPRIVR